MIINQNNFVQELSQKNEEALDYVMTAYGGLIKSILKRYLYRLPHLVEECLSDVFLQIWIHVDQFDPERNSFKNWVAGIARYRSIDYMRKYLHQQDNLSLEEVNLSEEDENLRKIVEEDAKNALEDLLTPLTEKDRRLFLLIYEEETSVSRTAEILQMKPSAVYNHLHRGKKKIKKSLEKGGQFCERK